VLIFVPFLSSYGTRKLFHRASKLDGIDLEDPIVIGDGIYGSAVNEVARLRSAHENRKSPSDFGSDHSEFLDDAQLKAGIARSLLDGSPSKVDYLEFAGRPHGVVSFWRTMAYALAGYGAGGNDVPPLR
jgi:hypothetical protein